MNAKQRREAAMSALPKIERPLTRDEALAVADAHAALAPLGRTARWQDACLAAHREIAEGADHNWAIIQTRVWMAWAL